MALVLYIGNDNIIELQTLTNEATGAADTGATVTVTLTDKLGANVTGQSWPATLAHVSGGTYRTTLADELAITANQRYYATVHAVGSGGQVGHWVERVIPLMRGTES